MSSVPKNCDVIIVGGGPAGVSCAITIAQAGYDVVILDKKARDQIGDKTCGDAIDKAALIRLQDRIGVKFPYGNEVSDLISKMSIAANEIDLKITLDAPGYLVDRLNYGQRLLREAEKLGVKIIARAPVRGVITEQINGEEYIVGVTYYHNKKKKEIRSKFTVDASGAYAVVRRELPQSMLNEGIKHELGESELWPTYREIITLDDQIANHSWPEEIVLMYTEKYPPPAYFWIFSKGHGMLNVGIGWEKTQDLGKLKSEFKKELHKYFKPDQYEVVKRGGGQIPFRPPFDSLVFNGGALAGDAACLVHPVTAEGHGPALDTASYLGKAIINGLETGRQDKEILWSYNEAVAHHYGRKHTEAEFMKDFLCEVGAPGLEYLIEKKIFKEDELNLIFAGGALELSFWEMVRRVMMLLPRPSIMFKLRELFSLSTKCKKIYQNYPSNPAELEKWRKWRNKSLKLNF